MTETPTPVTLRDALVAELTRLAAISDEAGAKTVATEIRDERIPALEEGRLTMVVLGEFNHGKSTVINALVGRDVLPTGITPTTSAITHIYRGDARARVVRDSGEEEVTPEAFRQLVTQEAAEDLRHVDLSVAIDPLVEGLVIVDTPGVNDISQQRAEITYGYIPRADVVVYVLDASQALKKSELTFIRERLVRNKLDRVFFVLGKSDALSTEELAEVREHVESRLAPVVGQVRLFPVSARKALSGGDEGFDAFREALQHELRVQRDQILIEGALRAARRLSSIVGHTLAIEDRALDLEAGELEERVARVRERLNMSRALVAENTARIERRTTEIAASARSSLASFVTSFKEALPQELSRAKADDIRRFLPDFLHHQFKEWIESEGGHTAMQLELLAEEVIAITNEKLAGALDAVESELGVSSREIDFETETLKYDAGVFALGAAGALVMAFSNVLIGGALLVAAPALAIVLRGRIDDALRERATEEALGAIDKAAQRVEQELDRMIAEFAERLQRFVEDAGDRLYRQVAEALDQVSRERREHSEDRGPYREELKGLRARLTEVQTRLKELNDAAYEGPEHKELLN